MTDEVFGILDDLRGTEPGPAEVRAAATRIAALGEAAVAPLLEALEEEDEAVLAVAAAALRRLGDPGVLNRLVRVLPSPRLGDVAKALVLGILEGAGMDIRDPSLVGTVLDLDGAVLAGSGPAPAQIPERAEGGNGNAGRPPEEEA